MQFDMTKWPSLLRWFSFISRFDPLEKSQIHNERTNENDENNMNRIVIYAISEWEVKQTYLLKDYLYLILAGWFLLFAFALHVFALFYLILCSNNKCNNNEHNKYFHDQRWPV